MAMESKGTIMVHGWRSVLARLIDRTIRACWWLRAKVDPEGTQRWKNFIDNATVMAYVHEMRP
jgi:hypothetical protein